VTDEDLLNSTQTAEVLGIGRTYVYELVRRGDLTPKRTHPNRFTREDVELLGDGWRRKRGPTHGLASTYRGYGCRCDECTRANTERTRLERADRFSRQPPKGSHGKATTYSNWGCRCGRCRKANTAYNAPYARAYQTRQKAMMS